MNEQMNTGGKETANQHVQQKRHSKKSSTKTEIKRWEKIFFFYFF